MKHVAILISLSLSLVACAGQKAIHGTATTSSSLTTSGSSVTNALGQTLQFQNDTGVAIGKVSTVTVNGNDVFVELFNPLSGRKATVKIKLDPNSRQFMSVEATGPKFMCHQPSENICAQVTVPTGSGFDFEGTVQRNCASPIFFAGALTGVVGNQTTNAIVTCGN